MKRILYFDCSAGISGDMVLGALAHLGADLDVLGEELGKLPVSGYEIVPRPGEMNGIKGVSLHVLLEGDEGDGRPRSQAGHAHEDHGHSHDGHWQAHGHEPHGHSHDGHAHAHGHGRVGEGHGGDGHVHGGEGHGHASYKSIRDMIAGSGLSQRAKDAAIGVFAAIAQAEAAVHGVALEDVAFHEVGAVDSVVDIVGTAVCMDLLGIDQVFCSPLHDGHGHVECRHGLIPVPVPAVVEMLKGTDFVLVSEDVATELVTPTGMGILKGLGAKCGPMPAMKVIGAGYGFGKRETGRFNALRVIMGETEG